MKYKKLCFMAWSALRLRNLFVTANPLSQPIASAAEILLSARKGELTHSTSTGFASGRLRE
jgi:hypothetical protein